MAIVTGSEFSRMAGVSKVAVSKAPQSKIFKNENGKIDTDNPINIVYLAEHSDKAKGETKPVSKTKKPAKAKPKKPEAKKPKTETEELPDTGDADIDADALSDDIANLTVRDKLASARYKEAAERKLTLEHQKKKGDLIERGQFVMAVQGINKAIDDHLHRLPAKLGPVLFAMARQEGGTELSVIRELEKGMGDAIRRAVEDVARLAPGADTVAK